MIDEKPDDCSTCPRCRMRERLTVALLAENGQARYELIEQLLDAVQAARDVDLADDDDRRELVDAAVEEAVLTVDTIQRIARRDDDLGDDTATAPAASVADLVDWAADHLYDLADDDHSAELNGIVDELWSLARKMRGDHSKH